MTDDRRAAAPVPDPWRTAAGAPPPSLPTAEELAELHPASDMLVALLDAASARALGRPLRPRLKVSPQGLLRGEIDVVKFEVKAFLVAGLVIDRFVVRAERVRIVPGLPPRLAAGPVGFRAIVSQGNVDRWLGSTRLPIKLRLTDEGIVTTAGFGGIRVTEVLTHLDVVQPFIRLVPQRASMLGVSTPMVRFLRGYLPLPPLPRDAHLESVEHTDGELTATFRIDEFEQALTPDLSTRLRRVLGVPGLR